MNFSMSSDRTLLTRSAYTIFGCLSAIGGLMGSLNFLFRSFSQFFVHKGVYFKMAPELFEVRRKQEAVHKFKKEQTDSNQPNSANGV